MSKNIKTSAAKTTAAKTTAAKTTTVKTVATTTTTTKQTTTTYIPLSRAYLDSVFSTTPIPIFPSSPIPFPKSSIPPQSFLTTTYSPLGIAYAYDDMTATPVPKYDVQLVINGNTSTIADTSYYNRNISLYNFNTTTLASVYGTYSMFSDASLNPSYLEVSSLPEIGQQDFCIEFWMCPKTKERGIQGLVEIGNNTTFSVYLNSGLYVSVIIGTQSWMLPSPNVGQWAHYAITRQGYNVRYFYNGILYSSTKTKNIYSIPSNPFRMGVYNNTPSKGNNCYYNGVRVIIKDCLYLSSFTPPKKPY